MRRHHILIPLAALLATLPLLLHGCSCGHDFDFHLQSWLDAAHQLRHGALYPRWAITPAFNAGEPRFLFYPPLSWMFGALLTLIVPIAAIPALYTFLVFTAAGFAMHHLARYFTGPDAALLAAIVYLANPYMLFNAFERTAYAELLASIWVPLLFLAILRKRPTVHGIAVPFALLWLTNAPAAVMGSYTFALLALFRVLTAHRATRLARPPKQCAQSKNPDAPHSLQSPLRLALTGSAGALLGLALPAFYLVPAAYERRYVQIAMAIIPNMRIQDNFLFGHTADPGHNQVLHTASLLAVTVLAVTLLTIALALARRFRENTAPAHTQSIRSFLAVFPQGNLLLLLLALTLLITFLLTPISQPIWLHLPELAFLQFSWRLLTILSAVLALALALLFRFSPTPRQSLVFWTLLIPIALTTVCIHLYRQPCELADTPIGMAQAFAAHHGVAPTDEYTPANADNDIIRPDDPAFWLSTDPNSFAPNTTPNPGSNDPDFDDNFPAGQTISAPAPHHLQLQADKPEFLVLNLRDYPNWRVSISCRTCRLPGVLPHSPRDDGLIAVPVPRGSDTVDISWHTTPDQWLGLLLSLCAVFALAWLFLANKP